MPPTRNPFQHWRWVLTGAILTYPLTGITFQGNPRVPEECFKACM
nr:MAG TPA: hypothetical protein [Bacteriophage sp.]